jgi:hypothetical protein
MSIALVSVLMIHLLKWEGGRQPIHQTCAFWAGNATLLQRHPRPGNPEIPAKAAQLV